MAPTDRAFCWLPVADSASFDKLEKSSERAQRDIRHQISLRVRQHYGYDIKLCLLLWFGFSKTMTLLVSVLRDFFFRCRKITLGLNRVQSEHS